MASKEQIAKRAERVGKVEKALVLGIGYREICRRFAKEYEVSIRIVGKDIEKIRMQWAEEAESEGKGDYRRNSLRQKFELIYQRAMADKAYNACVQACRGLMDLEGLRQIKVEHSGKVEHGVSDMTSDDKRRRMTELMSMAKVGSDNGKPKNGVN